MFGDIITDLAAMTQGGGDSGDPVIVYPGSWDGDKMSDQTGPEHHACARDHVLFQQVGKLISVGKTLSLLMRKIVWLFIPQASFE